MHFRVFFLQKTFFVSTISVKDLFLLNAALLLAPAVAPPPSLRLGGPVVTPARWALLPHAEAQSAMGDSSVSSIINNIYVQAPVVHLEALLLAPAVAPPPSLRLGGPVVTPARWALLPHAEVRLL